MLNTMLDDVAYRAWLIEVCGDLELMASHFETVEDCADEYSTRRLEKIVHSQYSGGIAQAALDSVPYTV